MNVLPNSLSRSARCISWPDIRIENHFSLFLVCPLSGPARRWLEENVQPDALWFGGALVVEPRYLPDLVKGMTADGLSLARERRRGRA